MIQIHTKQQSIWPELQVCSFKIKYFSVALLVMLGHMTFIQFTYKDGWSMNWETIDFHKRLRSPMTISQFFCFQNLLVRDIDWSSSISNFLTAALYHYNLNNMKWIWKNDIMSFLSNLINCIYKNIFKLFSIHKNISENRKSTYLTYHQSRLICD